jgi:hypothetical protein
MASDIKRVDTSMLYNDDEQSIMDHSLCIMNHLLKKHTNPTILDSMSIDKTDGLLRIIDSANKIVNTMATTKIRLMTINNQSDDRSRLIAILKNIDLRNNHKEVNANRNVTIEDADIVDVVVHTVRGELTDGIEQLSMELLDYEREVDND